MTLLEETGVGRYFLSSDFSFLLLSPLQSNCRDYLSWIFPFPFPFFSMVPEVFLCAVFFFLVSLPEDVLFFGRSCLEGPRRRTDSCLQLLFFPFLEFPS